MSGPLVNDGTSYHAVPPDVRHAPEDYVDLPSTSSFELQQQGHQLETAEVAWQAPAALRRQLPRAAAAVSLGLLLLAPWAATSSTALHSGSPGLRRGGGEAGHAQHATTSSSIALYEQVDLRPANLQTEFALWSYTQVCKEVYVVFEGFKAEGPLTSWEACAEACVRDMKCLYFAWGAPPIRRCHHYWACVEMVPSNLTMYRKLYNETNIYHEDTLEYTLVNHDAWCESSPPLLSQEGNVHSRSVLFGWEACKASCTTNLKCNYFLWKDAPSRPQPSMRFHCAHFSDCSETSVYQDTNPGQTQVFRKTKSPACRIASADELAIPSSGGNDATADDGSGEHVNFFMLAIHSPLSKERRDHYFKTQPKEMTDRTQIVWGAMMTHYDSVAQTACQQDVVPLSLPQIMNAVWRLPQLYYNQTAARGSICASIGHAALWRKAAQVPGWSVIMEDDALLQDGWTYEKLIDYIKTNSSGMGIVDLEARGCYHRWGGTAYAVTQDFAKKLVADYHHDMPQDIFVWKHEAPAAVGGLPSDIVGDPRTSGPHDIPIHAQMCLPYQEWPMNGWGAIPNRVRSYTRPSEIVGEPRWDKVKQKIVDAINNDYNTTNNEATH